MPDCSLDEQKQKVGVKNNFVNLVQYIGLSDRLLAKAGE